MKQRTFKEALKCKCIFRRLPKRVWLYAPKYTWFLEYTEGRGCEMQRFRHKDRPYKEKVCRTLWKAIDNGGDGVTEPAYDYERTCVRCGWADSAFAPAQHEYDKRLSLFGKRRRIQRYRK
jgi:hypothetical protein